MTPTLRLLGRLHDGLVWAMAVLAAAIAAGLVVLICADVLSRNLRLGTLPWTNEVTEYGLYGMTLLGAPWVLAKGAHVRMDLFARILPIAGVRVMEVVAALLGATIGAVLTYYAVVVTLAAQARGSMVLKTLVFPEWMLLAPMPVALGLLTVGFLRRAASMALDGPAAPDTPTSGAG